MGYNDKNRYKDRIYSKRLGQRPHVRAAQTHAQFAEHRRKYGFCPYFFGNIFRRGKNMTDYRDKTENRDTAEDAGLEIIRGEDEDTIGRDGSSGEETADPSVLDENGKESGGDSDEEEYEKICFVCRRPESKAGKMITMQPGLSICADCMQKTFDTMKNAGFDFAGGLGGAGTGKGTPGENSQGNSGMPNISMINLADLQNMIPRRQKVKKKKPQEEQKIPKAFDIHSIPAPHKIKEKLDDYVIGQDQAKKVISVAVYNHYKRVATNTMDDIEIEKSNMLMIGPTGSGKTYLVRTLAKLLDVPLAITDATSLTEAGYIGDDIESVVSKLLAAADNDVEKAEHGIIFIDEIDKIAKKKNTNQRDVSGESVQQGLLKLLEGSEVEVPVGANSKNAMVPLETVNTKNILFICGGAFPGLEDIIKERLNNKSAIGFYADLKDKYDNDKNLFRKVTVEDIKNFGMIPEFIGRLPIIFTLDGMTKDMLVKILKEPRNAILKQYQKLLALDEVSLEFEDDALEAIAEQALKKDTGARALRAIIEEFMLDIMYEIPKDDNIGKVTITRAYIEKTGGPVIEMRGIPMLEARN